MSVFFKHNINEFLVVFQRQRFYQEFFYYQLLYNLFEKLRLAYNINKVITKNINQIIEKMKHNQDLASWAISDPQNKQDYLPQPYRLIDQVLNETIIYNLSIAMHQIQEKKKNQNYEGKITEHVAQNLIQIQHVCCLSAKSKYQNYLVAGDKYGNILLIDIAKKSVTSKKELIQSKRVTFIAQCTVTDGQNSITSIAVILNSHPIITILRYKHSDSKLFVCEQVVITSQSTDLNKYPYECQFQDQGRLLIVKTYEGTIEGYIIPQITVDYQKIKTQNAINDQILSGTNQTKRQFLNPLQYADISAKSQKQIKQKKFQIKFNGYERPLKYKDLITKIKNKQKQQETESVQDTGNKKDSKKDSKKTEVPQTQTVQKITKQIQLNEGVKFKQPVLQNGVDVTQPYKLPKYQPFVMFIDSSVQYPRKKSFEKGGQLKICERMIYGWTNTKQFFCTNIRTGQFNQLPIYSQYLITKQMPTQQLLKSNFGLKSIQLNQKNQMKFKNVYPITCAQLTNQEQIFFALGLEDGTIALWNTKTMALQYNLDKHQGKITKLRFFQNWKLISGSDLGEVHIDNILDHRKQTKRTNIFQPKTEIPITDISVNDLGIAFVMDGDSNLRVYDLWRNQKISRVVSSNNFAVIQNKGRRWINSSSIVPSTPIYSNRDFTIVLSTKWPNIPNLFNMDENTKNLISRAQQIKKNPWMGNVSGVHLIRNFQFLLEHFQGLQNVYKKGYQKMKILNLFTNLEFAQLYDRNFDIPDFGHNLTSSPTHSKQLNKSRRSAISSQSKLDKSMKEKPNIGVIVGDQKKKVKLTSQVLHPQKFLFQRRKIQKRSIMTEQNLIQTIREQHKMKDRRQTLFKNDLAKTMI